MIEDKDFKIAETAGEALLARTIKSFENKIYEDELSLEISKVVLEYLKSKK